MSRIFTMAALAEKSAPELRKLFHENTQALAKSEAHSEERKAALSNLETIGRALAARYSAGP